MSDEMSDSFTEDELDQLLARCDAGLEAYARAHTDVESHLAAMTTMFPAPHPPAVSLFQARLQLREVELALTRAASCAERLALSRPNERTDELRRAVGRALATAGDLGRTSDLLRALNVALARALAVALFHRYPKEEEEDDVPLPELIIEVSRALTAAGDLTADMADVVDCSAPIDVAGADLSDVKLTSLTAIHGVRWDERTVWPPGMAEFLSVVSEEIEPGVFRVDYAPDVSPWQESSPAQPRGGRRNCRPR
ncbi:hypothetical protein ACIBF7_41305 [Nonomuraea sp. NPDC050478]|uniref:hypothetical protein n=1 Tax=Nonomuraea sp. NPDC050478 TaxID=3364365 RepID=UPI0037AB96E6